MGCGASTANGQTADDVKAKSPAQDNAPVDKKADEAPAAAAAAAPAAAGEEQPAVAAESADAAAAEAPVVIPPSDLPDSLATLRAVISEAITGVKDNVEGLKFKSEQVLGAIVAVNPLTAAAVAEAASDVLLRLVLSNDEEVKTVAAAIEQGAKDNEVDMAVVATDAAGIDWSKRT